MSFDDSTRTLIIFSKAPVAGQVKTRLQADIGPEACAVLQERMIRKTLSTSLASSANHVVIYTWPDMHHPLFQSLGKQYDISLCRQSGDTLGERMSQAFAQALENPGPVLLIGTDCPALTPKILDQCFDELEKGIDCVLVPALDGGYVLIGLCQHHPKVFENIDWGTEQVLEQTIEQLKALNLSFQCLPTLQDIDTINDLKACTELEIKDLLP
jgi:rSAM/selenodomain-associated transferase 1